MAMTQAAPAIVKIPTTRPWPGSPPRKAEAGRTPGRLGPRERDRAHRHQGRRRGHRAGARHHRLVRSLAAGGPTGTRTASGGSARPHRGELPAPVGLIVSGA
jgi:hypothetical protein